MSTINLDNKTILVTGAAGFIGSNLVKRIYQEAPSATVVGIDNMNDYYDVALKEFRLNELAKYPTFTFVKGNMAVDKNQWLIKIERKQTQHIFNAGCFTDVQTATARDLFDVACSNILDKFISNLVNKCRIHNVISFRGWHSE